MARILLDSSRNTGLEPAIRYPDTGCRRRMIQAGHPYLRDFWRGSSPPFFCLHAQQKANYTVGEAVIQPTHAMPFRALFLALLLAVIPISGWSENRVELHVFWSLSCPHCLEALPQEAQALSRARAFAEPLLAYEQLDTGENILAHADAVARILQEIGGSEAMQAAAYLVYA